jgi:hypothetical protein
MSTIMSIRVAVSDWRTQSHNTTIHQRSKIYLFGLKRTFIIVLNGYYKGFTRQ